ncbi:MAG: endonuclease III domain-containing protein [Phycisphaerae bacterium]|nr:endonuclease III domain-containing protein [Phycisphaerae bacterium]
MARRNLQSSRHDNTRSRRNVRTTVERIFDALYEAYGPQHWWPGESPNEIVIGAILTQNTSWKNVEKAIVAMRSAGLIDWRRLHDIPTDELAPIIRSAGYHNLKARRLKNFVEWLWLRYGGRLEGLRDVPSAELRAALLEINGIGPETADSILLYALDRPSFVVDAYTGRIARRHGLIGESHDYAALQALFEKNVRPDVKLFNEYHALIVAVGKRHCGPTARCDGCPLARFAHDETK